MRNRPGVALERFIAAHSPDVGETEAGRREKPSLWPARRDCGNSSGWAAVADAYATARFAGHPVIALIVGQAISGGFLTHGYQANRLLAFDDDEVLIHAMHKEAAARITCRTVDQLDELAKSVAPLSYNTQDYSIALTANGLCQQCKG